jgi:crossover junction endodeoxyribonuclease RuvC
MTNSQLLRDVGSDLDLRTVVYLAVDPGLSGVIAAITSIDKKMTSIYLADTPVVKIRGGKTHYDLKGMAESLKSNYNPYCTYFILEEVHAMPGQGVTSMFRFGEGFGLWRGLIAAYEYSPILITPQAWKSYYKFEKGASKDASRLKALELSTPYFDLAGDMLKNKNSHGKAEAFLMAYYVMNNFDKIKR